MSKGREIRCYDYVNHPYEQVRDALSKDSLAVFQAATKAASSRARSIASELRVEVGGIGVEADMGSAQGRSAFLPIMRVAAYGRRRVVYE